MGNTRWRYRVLTKVQADKIILDNRSSLRVEVVDGSPHLQILIKNKNGKVYYETLGRLRKDVFEKYNLVLMDEQPPEINISCYKFPNR